MLAVSEHAFNVVRSVGFLLAVVIAFALQRLAPHARLKGSWRTNLGLWLINLLVLSTVCGACAYTVARWARAAEIGLLAVVPLPLWASVLVCVPVLDFVSYLWHRANHQVRMLWRFHQVHHSDTTFTASTGVRFHPVELLLSLPVRLAAVVALGAPVQGVIIFEVLFTIANLVEHGDIDLPAGLEGSLGRLFITPAMHRLHHSQQWAELNMNFGTVFVLWDRLFSSYHGNASTTQVATGLPGVATAPSLLRALLLPVRQRSQRGTG
jgi:sterol desaturase/sphingolipid hydroxylase (fatty acid hydroxylase superfamily)